MENVNHPSHYNQHPSDIECIEIIRHYVCDIANALKYLWRAGLKPELGKEAAAKEVEDLKKALWYIEDYHQFLCAKACNEPEPLQTSVSPVLRLLTGHEPCDVCWGYTDTVSEAIRCLLCVGIIYENKVYANPEWGYFLSRARENIQKRIKEIDKTLKE